MGKAKTGGECRFEALEQRQAIKEQHILPALLVLYLCSLLVMLLNNCSMYVHFVSNVVIVEVFK
jgi:hypothetical protein